MRETREETGLLLDPADLLTVSVWDAPPGLALRIRTWFFAGAEVPGDLILGFITKGGAVSVHRVDCTNAASLREEKARLVDVTWDPTSASVFLVTIQVEALDRNRLLSDVTRVLSDHHVNILSASVQTSRNRVALSRFTFEMGEPSHLDHVIRAVRKIDGVFDVYRITGSKAAENVVHA